MSRIQQFLRRLGPSGAVSNAGRLQVERQHQDLVIRRMERVGRAADRADRAARTASNDARHRAA